MADGEGTTSEEDLPQPLGPLRTREVFIDTEAYRRIGFDTHHPSIVALLGDIAEDRLQLHLTDITSAEIARHIAADAEHAAEQIRKASATATKWRARAPQALGPAKSAASPTAAVLGREANEHFRQMLRPFTEHYATRIEPAAIFRDYFARKPPFDGKSAKEFPDAFAIAALANWCETESAQMYVVTADRAMQRAAVATERLLPVATLDRLLQIVTVAHSPDVVQIVETLLQTPAFDTSLETTIDRVIGDLPIVYSGDLVEGEASEPQRAGAPSEVTSTVISATDRSYGVVIEFKLDLLVQVHHDDISMASYDSEDGVYIGAEPDTAEIEEEVSLRMFLQIDADGSISRAEMLTSEVDIYGPHEDYK